MHAMYSPAMSFASMECWTKEKSAFPASDSPGEPGSARQAPSDSSGRSCSPTDSHSPPQTNQFQFESYFTKQQSFPMRRASGPYMRQHVSYLPETVNGSAWPIRSQQAAFNNPCPPKRYVFEAPRCCATPMIRVIHECCSKESTPREMLDEQTALPKRNFPTTTSTRLTLCRFCLKNGEPPSVYYSHNLHLEDGRVSCPVLRRYDCPICNNGGGDYAHTVRYCPRLRAGIVR